MVSLCLFLDMFEDKKLHLLLKRKKFDVVLSETFDFCGLCEFFWKFCCFISETLDLADYIGMPTIISVFSGVRLNAIRTALGEPSSLHYMPSTTISSIPTLIMVFKHLLPNHCHIQLFTTASMISGVDSSLQNFRNFLIFSSISSLA